MMYLSMVIIQKILAFQERYAARVHWINQRKELMLVQNQIH